MPLSDGEILSSRNVGKLTTYEIRQELVKRDAMDLEEKVINHRTLLERLVQELVKVEAKTYEEQNGSAVKAHLDEREFAKLERERKKAEAIERSKARQQDPSYFKRIADENSRLKEEADKKKQAQIEAAANVGRTVGAGDEEEEEDPFATAEEEEEEDDPFRTIKKKGRSKVHVR